MDLHALDVLVAIIDPTMGPSGRLRPQAKHWTATHRFLAQKGDETAATEIQNTAQNAECGLERRSAEPTAPVRGHDYPVVWQADSRRADQVRLTRNAIGE